MSYWLCEDVEISDDKTVVKLSFVDKHSSETSTIQMPVDVWRNILTYRNAYEAPERNMWEAHKNIARALWNEIELKKEK